MRPHTHTLAQSHTQTQHILSLTHTHTHTHTPLIQTTLWTHRYSQHSTMKGTFGHLVYTSHLSFGQK